MTHKALIGVGSNLGLAAENCEKAISLLNNSEFIQVTAYSSLYQSEPVGKKDQPWFVNGVVEVNTSLTPEELLQHLLDIERQFGENERKSGAPGSLTWIFWITMGKYLILKLSPFPTPK